MPMVQIMIEEERPCMVLMDSDVSRTFNRLETKQKSLQNGLLVVRQVNHYRKDAMSIEDLLPIDLLSNSVNSYINELIIDNILIKNDDIEPFKIETISSSIYKNLISPYVVTNFVDEGKIGDDWLREKVPLSKVGIARCFEKELENHKYDQNKESFKSSLKLINDLILILKLKLSEV